MIDLSHVRKQYGEQVVLDDVSFFLGPGEMGLITGPSGAGKTTLFRLLYLEERPDGGRILIGGREVTRLRTRARPFVRRNLGVVFQDFKLLHGRTALENVRVGLEVIGEPRARADKKSIRMLSRVGLSGRSQVPVERLSGGEQQRVAFARALVIDPSILLCDEPTGNLDSDASQAVLDLIAEAHEDGITCCIATHDTAVMAFAVRRNAKRLQLARRVVLPTSEDDSSIINDFARADEPGADIIPLPGRRDHGNRGSQGK